MRKLGRGRWDIEGGRAALTIDLRGVPGYTADLVATPDGGGPPIMLPAQFAGGIAEATIRGPERTETRPADPDHPDVSRPDLGQWRPTVVLTWRTDPSVAIASDALLLATDEGMQRAVRALWAALPPPGPPTGTGRQPADLVAAAVRLRKPDGTWPTEEDAAADLDLGIGVRQIRRIAASVGGWTEILRRAEGMMSR